MPKLSISRLYNLVRPSASFLNPYDQIYRNPISDSNGRLNSPFEVTGVRIRVRANYEASITKWKRELNRRSQEVLESLQREGVWMEASFLDNTPEGTFIIGYMKGRDLKRAIKVFQDSKAPIDQFHRDFKSRVWGKRSPLVCIVDHTDFDQMPPNARNTRMVCIRSEMSKSQVAMLKHEIEKLRKAPDRMDQLLRRHGIKSVSVFSETHSQSVTIWQFASVGERQGKISLFPIKALYPNLAPGLKSKRLIPLVHFENTAV